MALYLQAMYFLMDNNKLLANKNPQDTDFNNFTNNYDGDLPYL